MSINIFKRNDKKVYTEKQAQNIKQNSFNNGVMISFITIAGVQLLTGGVKLAAKSWKHAHDKMRDELMKDSEECEADFFEDDDSDDEVEVDNAEETPENVNNPDVPDVEQTVTVQEEAPSEPVTKVDETKSEEKDEVKTEEKKKEIDDDLRDIMNSIEQMPREKRKEISKQIDDGTFVVPEGINISDDTLKRLSIFMMNSAISEEEALKESENTKSDETENVNTEEKTA